MGDSIVAASTKVDSIENLVTVKMRLAVPCLPKAILRITYPPEFIRNSNAAFVGSAVDVGGQLPRQVEKRVTLNEIELVALEETIPANEELEITIGMSNPEISPRKALNI